MIGQILRQRYKIINKLGAGGIGETYFAEDLDMPVTPKPKCVVKRLHPRAIDPDIQRLFKKEAEILYKLGQNHDQIPKLFAYFEDNGEFYLVQELIEGNDLSQEIYSGKQWSEAEVIKFLQEMLEVLAFVHQNHVIHRDIKPSNIMRRGHDGKLVLIDFGIVKEVSTLVVNAQGQTVNTISIGTPGYQPSEQAQGKPRLSSDIYALGKVAIQALTGIAFAMDLPEDNDGEVIWRDQVQVSDELAEILTKMVRYDFRHRYQTAVEASQALTKALKVLKPIKISFKYGYIDQTGKLTILPQFDEATGFSEGLAVVKIGSKYGYIDKTGRVIIPLQFDKAISFSEGLAVVKIDSKYGYINKTGRVIIPLQFDWAWSFSEGLAEVGIGEIGYGKYGYIDKTGQVVIHPQFDWSLWSSFSEDLAAVKIGSKYGYIDKTALWVIPPQFDEATGFSEGLAAVKIGSKYGYIDKIGQMVIPLLLDDADGFSEELASVLMEDKCGYIDKTGRVVIPFRFEETWHCCEDLARVKLDSKYGYIDKTGQMIILPQFDEADDFSNEVAKVTIGEQERYIDKTGKFIY